MKRGFIEIDTLLSVDRIGGEVKQGYLDINFLSSVKDYEIETMVDLFSKLAPYLDIPSQKLGYLVDKSAECGIKEQFDILRFSNDTSINIELKYKMPKKGLSGILYQLQRHEHLLKNVCESVKIFCYILESNTLYQLKDSQRLEEINFEKLSKEISEDYLEDNLLQHLSSSSILISPYTEPEKFIKSRYFLSDEQRDVVNALLHDNRQLNAIIGGPGTGKSLILFELAKEYVRQKNKVLFIFSAKFEDVNFSSYFEFGFKPIREVICSEVISEYDVILVDEAQRLYESQLKELYGSHKVIFAVDHQQVLRFSEEKLEIEAILRSDEHVKKYELSEKIRSDRELSSFIHHFFDINSKIKIEKFNKINAVHFKTTEEAEQFIDKAKSIEGYVPIELSQYIKRNWNRPNEVYRNQVYNQSRNQFDVIGREYDKVLVVIDKSVRYDEQGKLIVPQRNYDYNERNGLFEAMTRVRESLLLVFVNNEEMFCHTHRLLTLTSDEIEEQEIKGLLTKSQRLEEGLIAENIINPYDYVTTNRKLRNKVGEIIKHK